MDWPGSVTVLIKYLGFINFILAGFNLLPAFPLDGGCVFRVALWKYRGDLWWSTRVASRLGSTFGMELIFMGLFFIIRGGFITVLWWAFIGILLRSASQMELRRLQIREALRDQSVTKFMISDPISVSPSTTIGELVEEYVYKHHHKMYPVVEDGRLMGCITTREVKEVPRGEWSDSKILDIVQSCSE
jgi:hypothetical protein